MVARKRKTWPIADSTAEKATWLHGYCSSEVGPQLAGSLISNPENIANVMVKFFAGVSLEPACSVQSQQAVLEPLIYNSSSPFNISRKSTGFVPGI